MSCLAIISTSLCRFVSFWSESAEWRLHESIHPLERVKDQLTGLAGSLRGMAARRPWTLVRPKLPCGAVKGSDTETLPVKRSTPLAGCVDRTNAGTNPLRHVDTSICAGEVLYNRISWSLNINPLSARSCIHRECHDVGGFGLLIHPCVLQDHIEGFVSPEQVVKERTKTTARQVSGFVYRKD